MRTTVIPSQRKSYAELRDHTAIGRAMAGVIAADPRLRGAVLDVGCGPDGPTIPAYHDVYRLPARLDGLDPFPGVEHNPWLERAWRGEFESCEVPAESYDAIVTINVVEHVSRPAEFLRQALRVLRPGGALWAVTPSASHPFPYFVLAVQAAGLKERMVAGTEWNNYPAYYRLNTRRSVARAAREAGFGAAEFHGYACTQWHGYFPAPLRFAPAIFDRLIGIRVQRYFQIMLWRLVKAGEWTGPLVSGPAPARPRARGADTVPAAAPAADAARTS